MNIYCLKQYEKSCDFHKLCFDTKTNVTSWDTHRQIKYILIRQVLRSCLIWIKKIKRPLKASPGLNVLTLGFLERRALCCELIKL